LHEGAETQRAKVAVLISGGGTNMAALLYASRAANCPYEIVLVASNNPEAGGLRLAEAEGVATFALSHKGTERGPHDMAMDAAIRESGAEYVALAGYMRILTPEFVSGWEGRMLNIHPSLLPKYKGLKTHDQAIANGDSHGGCSVHLVTAELDDGPVLAQTPVAIVPGDTAETLAARVLIAEHQLYSRALAGLVAQSASPEWLLDQVRERALVLPEAAEKLSHGSPGFFVQGGKFFAYFSANHHGDGKIALILKISGLDEQLQLIENDADRYSRPAYFGDGWISVRLDIGGIDWDHIAGWLERSWRMSAPKKLTALMNVADEF
jgi:formyltetrahydrofolate-dependent phosphoribosylglycinamide formyltransferase